MQGVINTNSLTSSGTVAGGLTNTGTVNANGGAVNGAINNNAGTFNVGGTVTANSTFDNAAATSRLLINSGSYSATGLITNSGSNAAGGILVANGATLNGEWRHHQQSAAPPSPSTPTASSMPLLNNAGTVTNNLHLQRQCRE